jgi:hypothetical protein
VYILPVSSGGAEAKRFVGGVSGGLCFLILQYLLLLQNNAKKGKPVDLRLSSQSK